MKILLLAVVLTGCLSAVTHAFTTHSSLRPASVRNAPYSRSPSLSHSLPLTHKHAHSLTRSPAHTQAHTPSLAHTYALTPAENAQHYERTLDAAYARCAEITARFSKTFSAGVSLLPRETRRHVHAVYAWCRRTDDLVDAPRSDVQTPSHNTQHTHTTDDTPLAHNTSHTLNTHTTHGSESVSPSLCADLSAWERRLDETFAGRPHDLLDLALHDAIQYYAKRGTPLSAQPYRDMLKGMQMDIPASPLSTEKYRNFDELYVYCYRVASTVGLMTLPMIGVNTDPVRGCVSPKDWESVRSAAVALGVALQLTNIIRDVGEDLLTRGRVYLPQDELAAFGVEESDLLRGEVTPAYRRLMQFQISRARRYYALAEQGLPLLSPAGRLAVRASLDLYSEILRAVERNDYDNLRRRAYTTKWEKARMLPLSAVRALVF